MTEEKKNAILTLHNDYVARADQIIHMDELDPMKAVLLSQASAIYQAEFNAILGDV